MTRRDFLRLMALSGLVLATPDVLKAEDKKRKWAMAVDLTVPEGSFDLCASACHKIHNVPDIPDAKKQIKWIWLSPFEALFPDAPEYTKERKTVALCNHCENPPCVSVCPTQATFQRADGIVMMDYHRCIGCRYCMAACPYGARSFNWYDPRPFIKSVDLSFPTRTKGVVEKCNFCEERLAKNLLPACVEAAKNKGLVFGDLNDGSSEIRRVLSSRRAMQRKAYLGTKPKVFYLV